MFWEGQLQYMPHTSLQPTMTRSCKLISTLAMSINGHTMWMLLTRMPPCFSTISYRSVEIRDHRCRMLQKIASRKTNFTNKWFLICMFVLKSVSTTLGQICNCYKFCIHFFKASHPFQYQLQQRELYICSKKHII